MYKKNQILLVVVLYVVFFFIAACSTSEVTPYEPTQVGEPTELRVAAALTAGLENSWDNSFVESFNRIRASAPHGLTIHELDFTEGVWGDEMESVVRAYARTGLYDIIWINSSGSDQVDKLMTEYPDILWVTVGSGNRPLGNNSYLIYQHIHECGYLQGILAGSLTETNRLGVVGTFPADDVYDVINGFKAGALSVNPDISLTVSFIESWYDPPKGVEAANAQIAAGVDHLYMMAEAFEPCEEQGIICYGKYIDHNFAAPNAVLASILMYWEPHINYVIDEWWNHKTTSEAYNAPMERVWFSMAEGACDISPFHALDSYVPEDVKATFIKAKEAILNGTLEVELIMEAP